MHAQMPERGVYVDCGCYHPETLSNTAYWRDKGWTGLAIDANAHLAPHWKPFSAQFVHAAIGDGKPIKFEMNDANPAWSRAGSGVETPTRPLNSIMAEYHIGKIDLLCLDLEGMEYDALLTLDLEKHQPSFIISEYDTDGIGKDWRVLEYLLKGNYVALHMTASNVIYQRAMKKKTPWPL